MRLKRSGLDGHDGTDGRKAFAMEYRRPGVAQALGVQRRAVAFVPVEGVVRSKLMVERHACVTEHLGHDGGAGDHVTALVASHNGPARDGKRRGQMPIDQDEVRRGRQIPHRLLHGTEGRLKNVAPVDLFGADDPDPNSRVLEDDSAGSLALSRGEALRVIDPHRQSRPVQDDRRGHDRPGPWPAAHFIDAGDAPKSRGTRLRVRLKRRGCRRACWQRQRLLQVSRMPRRHRSV